MASTSLVRPVLWRTIGDFSRLCEKRLFLKLVPPVEQRLSVCRVCNVAAKCKKECNSKILCRQKIKINKMSSFVPGEKDFIFRQVMDYTSHTYTYILADPYSREAVIIDPVIEMVERDVKIIQDLGLTLVYAINTHVHADHVTGTGEIKKKIPSCKSMISKVSKAQADVKLVEGDKIKFGKYELDVRNTPGHTNGCVTYVWHDKQMAFTGDALLIRGCGRTDFQEGSSKILYESVHNKIFSLPPNYSLYPAHDYTGQTSTTVEEEKNFNPRLSKTKEEFIKIMSELNLPYPKQIDKALPANMVCGLQPLK